MKTVLALVCTLALCGSGIARLGDTRDQAEARYGLPKSEKPKYDRPLIEGAKELTFEYEGWQIRCALLFAKDGKEYIVREEYRKIWNSEVMKRGGVIQIRDFERDAVLEAEGGLPRWSQKLVDGGNDRKADLSTQFAHALLQTGNTWGRDDGAVARRQLGGDSITLDLPQALRYEAELRTIKDRNARADARRLFERAPVPERVISVSVQQRRQLQTAPVVIPNSPVPSPSAAALSTRPAPSPVKALPTTNPPSSEPPVWFMVLCLGLMVLGLAFVCWLILQAARRFIRRDGFKPAGSFDTSAARSTPSPLPSSVQTQAESSRPRSFKDLSWDEFEMLVGEIYRRAGYQVEISGGTGADGGVDLVLRKDHEYVLVQCKNWNASKVSAREVREFFGVLVSEGATRGIFVTAGQYTRDAREFTEGKPIELVNGSDLSLLVEKAQNDPADDLLHVALWAPVFAQAAIVTDPACPFCRSSMVVRHGSRGDFWGCSTYPRCRGKREVRRYLITH